MQSQPNCQVEKTEESSLIDIVQTKRNINEMEKQLANQIADLYPVGADIRWQKGRNNLSGTVKRHNRGTRIQVENSLTLRTYWIEIYDVLERHGLNERVYK